MNTKKYTIIVTSVAIIMSATVFLAKVPNTFADDAIINSLYNNQTLQQSLNTNDQSVQWHNNQQQNIRIQLRNLLREHTVIGGIAFLARFENSTYLMQLQQQVQQNTDKLTATMGQLYGQNQEDNFRDLWMNHIDLLNQYTDARKDNDENMINQTNDQLQDNADRLADFFAQKNPSQHSQILQMMQTHINDEKAIIDIHAAGQDRDLLNLFIQGVDHSDMMTDQIIQLAYSHRR